jgi:hypothetical protein
MDYMSLFIAEEQVIGVCIAARRLSEEFLVD